MHPTSRILLPKLRSLVNCMKLSAPLGVWKRNCKRWRCNKLGHLLLSMMGIILIDLVPSRIRALTKSRSKSTTGESKSTQGVAQVYRRQEEASPRQDKASPRQGVAWVEASPRQGVARVEASPNQGVARSKSEKVRQPRCGSPIPMGRKDHGGSDAVGKPQVPIPRESDKEKEKVASRP